VSKLGLGKIDGQSSSCSPDLVTMPCGGTVYILIMMIKKMRRRRTGNIYLA
jgi:hypothetical protein